jgi:hypothetical protein
MTPKIKAVFQCASAISTAVGLRSKFREARENKDRLALVDTIITALGLVTGLALAVRTLRRPPEDEDE